MKNDHLQVRKSFLNATHFSDSFSCLPNSAINKMETIFGIHHVKQTPFTK